MPNIINEVVVNGNTYGLPGSGTLSNLATIESNASAASKAYAIGDHLVLNDVYYVVTAAIAHNDALLVGTNISVAKAGDEISQLNNDLNDFSFRLNNGKPEYSTDGGTTWNKLGGGSIPTLDYSNPLYQFTANTSYRCTMECYMVATALGTVSVNNVPLTSILTITNTSYPSVGLPLLKLRANDIVTLTGCDFRGTKVIIYKEA